jgi:hypothetical protein
MPLLDFPLGKDGEVNKRKRSGGKTIGASKKRFRS